MRPDVPLRRNLDEVGSHADPVAGLRNSPFHYGINIQFPCDFTNRFLRLQISIDGGSRNHSKGARLTQSRDQRFGHAIAEVLLVGATGREALKWKHRNGLEYRLANRKRVKPTKCHDTCY